MKIPLASSGLRASDIDLVTQVLKSGNLTMGKEVKKFEEMMCDYLKVNHFIMVNSGSSANLLILEALIRPTKSKPMLHPGDGVLVPAIAWPTTIWPIIQLGLIPIFVDVSEKTLAIDLTKAQELIDESKIHVAAIFPIHPLGLAMSPTELNSFVNRNGLVLINDVCESLGSWRENLHAGTSGLAASFSFYFSHHITTMEGGGWPLITLKSLMICVQCGPMAGQEIDTMHKSGKNTCPAITQSFFSFQPGLTLGQWKFKPQ